MDIELKNYDDIDSMYINTRTEGFWYRGKKKDLAGDINT